MRIFLSFRFSTFFRCAEKSCYSISSCGCTEELCLHTEIFLRFFLSLLCVCLFVRRPTCTANANICKNSAAFVFYAFFPFFLLAKCFWSVLFSLWIITIYFSFSFVQCAPLCGLMVLRYSNHSTFIRRAVFVEFLPTQNAPRFIGCHALCKGCAGSLSTFPANKHQLSTMHELGVGKCLAFVWCRRLHLSKWAGKKGLVSDRNILRTNCQVEQLFETIRPVS